jgi:pSer/pThr/pTyr-binding forkhead associated (FHA) protein
MAGLDTEPTEDIEIDDEVEPTDVGDLEGRFGDWPRRTVPPHMYGRLAVLKGSEPGKVYYLKQPQNKIGRHPDSAVRLEQRSVSAEHALIFFSAANEWRIRDLKSRNGTLLNGSKVTEFGLRSGDQILVGETLLEFTVEHLAQPARNPGPPTR